MITGGFPGRGIIEAVHHPGRVLVSLLGTAVLLGGLLVARPAEALPAPATGTTATTATTSAPCGWRATPRATYRHVVWIVLENHSYEDLIGPAGSSAAKASPYVNSLAQRCGLATNSWAITHPSLPNYLAQLTGSTGGVRNDCTPAQCPQQRRTLLDQVRHYGGSWRVLAESMPTACDRSDTGDYVARHNVATYFASLSAGCHRWDLPMGSTTSGRLVDLAHSGHLPTFLLVVPNLCHSTHDCGVGTGDQWLSQVVPLITSGPDYRAGRTALFITWDEGSGGSDGETCATTRSRSCHIATLVVTPSTTAGARGASRYDQYSLLKTTELALGIRTLLGHAADGATLGMRRAFRF
jgi:phosphatidylinositol-3-phosphatase